MIKTKINKFNRFNIFLKILRHELGFKGFFALLFFTLILGIRKEPNTLLFHAFFPALVMLAIIIDFTKDNKQFLQYFHLLPNSKLDLILFSKSVSLLYSSYIFSVYILLFQTVSFEIVYVILLIYFSLCFVINYIFLKSINNIFALILLIFFSIAFSAFLSLILNVFLLSASIFFETKHKAIIINQSYIKPRKIYKNDFSQYKIYPSNYIREFLKITIDRNQIHRFFIRDLVILLFLIEIFIIYVIYRDNNLSFFNFVIFVVPILLALILTYFFVLLKKLKNQLYSKGIVQDAVSQLSKLYFFAFYGSIIVILLFAFIKTGNSIINPDLIYTIVSLALYSHYFFYALSCSEKYIPVFGFIFTIGVFTSLAPPIFKLLISLFIFTLVIFYFRKSRKIKYVKA